MRGKLSPITELKEQTGGTITLGYKAKCNILGVGKVGSDSSDCKHDVLLVDGLKYNLLSSCQLCDKENQVIFDKDKCQVKCIKSGKICIIAPRCDNMYSMFTNKVDTSCVKCLKPLTDDPKLWYRRYGHLNMHTTKLLASYELCKLCTKGK